MWQVVLQSQLIHPDWDVQIHLDYLEQEGYDWNELSSGGLSPEDIVSGWLLANPLLPLFQQEQKRMNEQ